MIKHTLEWLEIFTEWYVGSKDNPLEFVSGEASKKILNERRVTNLFNPAIFFQPCEKDPKKGTCNICSQELLYSTSNGSLRRHVTRYDFTSNVNKYLQFLVRNILSKNCIFTNKILIPMLELNTRVSN